MSWAHVTSCPFGLGPMVLKGIDEQGMIESCCIADWTGQNGVLLYGLITIVTKKFRMVHVTMSHLWGHACSA